MENGIDFCRLSPHSLIYHLQNKITTCNQIVLQYRATPEASFIKTGFKSKNFSSTREDISYKVGCKNQKFLQFLESCPMLYSRTRKIWKYSTWDSHFSHLTFSSTMIICDINVFRHSLLLSCFPPACKQSQNCLLKHLKYFILHFRIIASSQLSCMRFFVKIT